LLLPVLRLLVLLWRLVLVMALPLASPAAVSPVRA
jgi:hypothetical protein